MEKFERQHVSVDGLPPALLEKWPGNSLSEGFVPVPKKFLRNFRRIFPDSPEIMEIAALLSMVDFKRPNPTRKPSLEYLAFVAGLTDDEFHAAVGRLMQKNLISVAGDEEELDTSIDGLLSQLEEPPRKRREFSIRDILDQQTPTEEPPF